MTSIDALNVSTTTVSRDLEGFPAVGRPQRPKGGRPKAAPKRRSTR